MGTYPCRVASDDDVGTILGSHPIISRGCGVVAMSEVKVISSRGSNASRLTIWFPVAHRIYPMTYWIS